MSFHVGQKVKCIRTWDRGGTGYGDEQGPVEGREYTIRAIGHLCPLYPGTTVLLEEIWNGERPYRNGICEGSFCITRFRPIIEDRKSVSFTIGADPDSDIWDNRKKTKEKV